MNIQRFVAPTSREALAKARRQFGENAVVLSTRQTDDGFEVMATSEDGLAAIVPAVTGMRSATRPERDDAPSARPEAPSRPSVQDTVDRDTQTMAMSTLSFQEYARERMLRKRREALQPGPGGESRAAAPMDHAAAAAAPREERPPLTSMASGASDARMAQELASLKAMIEERFDTLAWLGGARHHPIQAGLMHRLIRAGYSPAMAKAVLERLPAQLDAADASRWVTDVLVRNLRTAQASLVDEGGVLALVGATGVGKTTTAAKLAARCVQAHGADSVGLITLDTYRVAGYEQLRTYGRMLGVAVHLAQDREALVELLQLLAARRLVIIDTAGLGQRDQRVQDVLDMLELPQVKKTVVLNAAAQGDTLDEVLAAFKPRGLHGVVLSKVDEAAKLGPAIDALIRHRLVLRGVATGQRVPEDWQAPDAAALVRVSLGGAAKSVHDPNPADMGYFFNQASVRGIDLGLAHV
jgi:flagellar biosynthesis protein FlhF